METIIFRTNIGCCSCIKAAFFFLDENDQIPDWHIDTSHQDKVLTIRGLQVSKQKTIQEISFADFTIESIEGVCNTRGCSI